MVKENFFSSHKSKKYISMSFKKIVFLNFSIQAAPFSHGPIGTLKTPAWGGGQFNASLSFTVQHKNVN